MWVSSGESSRDLGADASALQLATATNVHLKNLLQKWHLQLQRMSSSSPPTPPAASQEAEDPFLGTFLVLTQKHPAYPSHLRTCC